MPFLIPQETLAYWKRRPAVPVTDLDIAMLEARMGKKAPAAYTEFMKTYGPVSFDDDLNCRFDFVIEAAGQSERASNAISFVKAPEKALRYYDGLQKDPKLSFPKHLLLFAMDYGQGELLIEFGPGSGRVFFWDFDRHDWETGTTHIRFVAANLFDFINGLRPFDA